MEVTWQPVFKQQDRYDSLTSERGKLEIAGEVKFVLKLEYNQYNDEQ